MPCAHLQCQHAQCKSGREICSEAQGPACLEFTVQQQKRETLPPYGGRRELIPKRCLLNSFTHAYLSHPELQINHPEAQLQSSCPPPVIKLENASPSLKLSTNPSSCHSSNFPNELQHIYSHLPTIYYPSKLTWRKRNQESSRTGESIIKSRSGPTAKRTFQDSPCQSHLSFHSSLLYK